MFLLCMCIIISTSLLHLHSQDGASVQALASTGDVKGRTGGQSFPSRHRPRWRSFYY